MNNSRFFELNQIALEVVRGGGRRGRRKGKSTSSRESSPAFCIDSRRGEVILNPEISAFFASQERRSNLSRDGMEKKTFFCTLCISSQRIRTREWGFCPPEARMAGPKCQNGRARTGIRHSREDFSASRTRALGVHCWLLCCPYNLIRHAVNAKRTKSKTNEEHTKETKATFTRYM